MKMHITYVNHTILDLQFKIEFIHKKIHMHSRSLCRKFGSAWNAWNASRCRKRLPRFHSSSWFPFFVDQITFGVNNWHHVTLSVSLCVVSAATACKGRSRRCLSTLGTLLLKWHSSNWLNRLRWYCVVFILSHIVMCYRFLSCFHCKSYSASHSSFAFFVSAFNGALAQDMWTNKMNFIYESTNHLLALHTDRVISRTKIYNPNENSVEQR